MEEQIHHPIDKGETRIGNHLIKNGTRSKGIENKVEQTHERGKIRDTQKTNQQRNSDDVNNISDQTVQGFAKRKGSNPVLLQQYYTGNRGIDRIFVTPNYPVWGNYWRNWKIITKDSCCDKVTVRTIFGSSNVLELRGSDLIYTLLDSTIYPIVNEFGTLPSIVLNHEARYVLPDEDPYITKDEFRAIFRTLKIIGSDKISLLTSGFENIEIEPDLLRHIIDPDNNEASDDGSLIVRVMASNLLIDAMASLGEDGIPDGIFENSPDKGIYRSNKIILVSELLDLVNVMEIADLNISNLTNIDFSVYVALQIFDLRNPYKPENPKYAGWTTGSNDPSLIVQAMFTSSIKDFLKSAIRANDYDTANPSLLTLDNEKGLLSAMAILVGNDATLSNVMSNAAFSTTKIKETIELENGSNILNRFISDQILQAAELRTENISLTYLDGNDEYSRLTNDQLVAFVDAVDVLTGGGDLLDIASQIETQLETLTTAKIREALNKDAVAILALISNGIADANFLDQISWDVIDYDSFLYDPNSRLIIGKPEIIIVTLELDSLRFSDVDALTNMGDDDVFNDIKLTEIDETYQANSLLIKIKLSNELTAKLGAQKIDRSVQVDTVKDPTPLTYLTNQEMSNLLEGIDILFGRGDGLTVIGDITIVTTGEGEDEGVSLDSLSGVQSVRNAIASDSKIIHAIISNAVKEAKIVAVMPLEVYDQTDRFTSLDEVVTKDELFKMIDGLIALQITDFNSIRVFNAQTLTVGDITNAYTIGSYLLRIRLSTELETQINNGGATKVDASVYAVTELQIARYITNDEMVHLMTGIDDLFKA
ncbi:MAG: hypothetical protein EZS28_031972, partial [Streblomastix strix]